MERHVGNSGYNLELRQLQAQFMSFDQVPVIRHLTNVGEYSTEGQTVLNNLRQARTFAIREARKSCRVIDMALFVQSVIVGGKSTVLGESLYYGLSSGGNTTILSADKRSVTLQSEFGDVEVAGVTYPWSVCVDYAQRHGFHRQDDGSWSPHSLQMISAIPLSAQLGIRHHLTEFLDSRVDVLIHAADGIPTYCFDETRAIVGYDRNGSLLKHFARSPRRLHTFHIVPDTASVDSRLLEREQLHKVASLDAYRELMALTGKPIIGEVSVSYKAAKKSAKPEFMDYLKKDVKEALHYVQNSGEEGEFSWHNLIALYEHYAQRLRLRRSRTFIGYNTDIPDSEAQIANWEGFISRFDAVTWMEKHYPAELERGIKHYMRRIIL